MRADRPLCGAKCRGERAGRTCRNLAGARTPYSGTPGARCWMHGGAAAAANLTHGRDSKVLRTSLREMLAEHARESIGRAAVSELVAALYEVAVMHVTSARHRATFRSEWDAILASVAPGATVPRFLADPPATREDPA